MWTKQTKVKQLDLFVLNELKHCFATCVCSLLDDRPSNWYGINWTEIWKYLIKIAKILLGSSEIMIDTAKSNSIINNSTLILISLTNGAWIRSTWHSSGYSYTRITEICMKTVWVNIQSRKLAIFMFLFDGCYLAFHIIACYLDIHVSAFVDHYSGR